MEEHPKLQCQFKITPLTITVNNSTPRSSACSSMPGLKIVGRAVVLKLGESTGRSNYVGQSIVLQHVDLHYLNETGKFAPIKGIIKVYDIFGHGSDATDSPNSRKLNNFNILSHDNKNNNFNNGSSDDGGGRGNRNNNISINTKQNMGATIASSAEHSENRHNQKFAQVEQSQCQIIACVGSFSIQDITQYISKQPKQQFQVQYIPRYFPKYISRTISKTIANMFINMQVTVTKVLHINASTTGANSKHLSVLHIPNICKSESNISTNREDSKIQDHSSNSINKEGGEEPSAIQDNILNKAHQHSNGKPTRLKLPLPISVSVSSLGQDDKYSSVQESPVQIKTVSPNHSLSKLYSLYTAKKQNNNDRCIESFTLSNHSNKQGSSNDHFNNNSNDKDMSNIGLVRKQSDMQIPRVLSKEQELQFEQQLEKQLEEQQKQQHTNNNIFKKISIKVNSIPAETSDGTGKQKQNKYAQQLQCLQAAHLNTDNISDNLLVFPHDYGFGSNVNSHVISHHLHQSSSSSSSSHHGLDNQPQNITGSPPDNVQNGHVRTNVSADIHHDINTIEHNINQQKKQDKSIDKKQQITNNSHTNKRIKVQNQDDSISANPLNGNIKLTQVKSRKSVQQYKTPILQNKKSLQTHTSNMYNTQQRAEKQKQKSKSKPKQKTFQRPPTDIRRVNTLNNDNQTDVPNINGDLDDFIDLKSGINFGYSHIKSNQNTSSISSGHTGSKLQAKAQQLKKNNLQHMEHQTQLKRKDSNFSRKKQKSLQKDINKDNFMIKKNYNLIKDQPIQSQHKMNNRENLAVLIKMPQINQKHSFDHTSKSDPTSNQDQDFSNQNQAQVPMNLLIESNNLSNSDQIAGINPKNIMMNNNIVNNNMIKNFGILSRFNSVTFSQGSNSRDFNNQSISLVNSNLNLGTSKNTNIIGSVNMNTDLNTKMNLEDLKQKLIVVNHTPIDNHKNTNLDIVEDSKLHYSQSEYKIPIANSCSNHIIDVSQSISSFNFSEYPSIMPHPVQVPYNMPIIKKNQNKNTKNNINIHQVPIQEELDNQDNHNKIGLDLKKNVVSSQTLIQIHNEQAQPLLFPVILKNHHNPLITPLKSNQNNPDLTMSCSSLVSNPQILQQYQKTELQTLGQLLVEQRRKNVQNEQKIQKMQLKIITLKQKYHTMLEQWQEWCQLGDRFLGDVCRDKDGNYQFSVNKVVVNTMPSMNKSFNSMVTSSKYNQKSRKQSGNEKKQQKLVFKYKIVGKQQEQKGQEQKNFTDFIKHSIINCKNNRNKNTYNINTNYLMNNSSYFNEKSTVKQSIQNININNEDMTIPEINVNHMSRSTSMKEKNNEEFQQGQYQLVNIAEKGNLQYNIRNNNSDVHLTNNNVKKHQRVYTQPNQILPYQYDKVIKKIEQTYSINNKLVNRNKQLQEQITKLQSTLQQQKATAESTQQQNTKLMEYIQYIESNKQSDKSQIQHLEKQIKASMETNAHLKQKDQQMQTIILQKQQAIANLKKTMHDNNAQIEELEDQIANYKKNIENKEYMIEELKEQIADREDIIQIYRDRYGEVNRYYSGIVRKVGCWDQAGSLYNLVNVSRQRQRQKSMGLQVQAERQQAGNNIDNNASENDKQKQKQEYNTKKNDIQYRRINPSQYQSSQIIQNEMLQLQLTQNSKLSINSPFFNKYPSSNNKNSDGMYNADGNRNRKSKINRVRSLTEQNNTQALLLGNQLSHPQMSKSANQEVCIEQEYKQDIQESGKTCIRIQLFNPSQPSAVSAANKDINESQQKLQQEKVEDTILKNKMQELVNNIEQKSSPQILITYSNSSCSSGKKKPTSTNKGLLINIIEKIPQDQIQRLHQQDIRVLTEQISRLLNRTQDKGNTAQKDQLQEQINKIGEGSKNKVVNTISKTNSIQ